MNKYSILITLILFGLIISFFLYLDMREIEELEQQLQQLNTQIQQLDKQIYEFLKKWDIAVMEATAYAPYDSRGMCNDGNPSVTSIRVTPGPGTIAVNPEVIPYKTKMWVQGYGWGRAEDTGGMIRARDDLIDVYMDTYSQAMEWGRRKVVVVYERK